MSVSKFNHISMSVGKFLLSMSVVCCLLANLITYRRNYCCRLTDLRISRSLKSMSVGKFQCLLAMSIGKCRFVARFRLVKLNDGWQVQQKFRPIAASRSSAMRALASAVRPYSSAVRLSAPRIASSAAVPRVKRQADALRTLVSTSR